MPPFALAWPQVGRLLGRLHGTDTRVTSAHAALLRFAGESLAHTFNVWQRNSLGICQVGMQFFPSRSSFGAEIIIVARGFTTLLLCTGIGLAGRGPRRVIHPHAACRTGDPTASAQATLCRRTRMLFTELRPVLNCHDHRKAGTIGLVTAADSDAAFLGCTIKSITSLGKS